jgi:cytochrome c biogenesis protein CcdA
MLETFTPAVCGSRKRQIAGQTLFAVSAVLTSATLGLLLGLAGSMLGAEQAVLGAAALALVAAAREAGLIRFSIPQARRQVPEHWRFERPLPVWASGYGAGLGAGFFTYQPISTFWVACAGALALAEPVPAALCVSLYGAGRALMIVWPRRRVDDPTAAVERLTSRRGALLRANVVALVACGVLLAVAPAAGAGVTRIATNAYDPAVDRGNVAFSTAGGNVVVRRPGGGETTYPDATEPSLSGPYLAYRDSAGIRVIRWADGTEVRRIASPYVSKPALAWPLVAFVRRVSPYDKLFVRNLVTGKVTLYATVRLPTDLGRPSLRHGRLAWHTQTRRESKIMVVKLSSRARRTMAVTRIGMLGNPSVYRTKVVWVDARFGVTFLKQGWLTSSRRVVLARVRSRTVSYWTTAVSSNAAYMTRWVMPTVRTDLYRRTP